MSLRGDTTARSPGVLTFMDRPEGFIRKLMEDARALDRKAQTLHLEPAALTKCFPTALGSVYVPVATQYYLDIIASYCREGPVCVDLLYEGGLTTVQVRRRGESSSERLFYAASPDTFYALVAVAAMVWEARSSTRTK